MESKENHGPYIPAKYKTRWILKYSDPARKYRCNRTGGSTMKPLWHSFAYSLSAVAVGIIVALIIVALLK